ncbi:hypothetical protein CsSME_00051556 [Camellia sinensis var. sinensis]
MEMNDRSKGGSPYRRHQNDEEAAAAATEEEAEASSGGGGPFQIFRTKDASVDRLKRWRDLVMRRTIGSSSAENCLYFLDQLDKLAHFSTTSPTITDDIWLWHRRLGHSSFYLLKHLFPSVFSHNNV